MQIRKRLDEVMYDTDFTGRFPAAFRAAAYAGAGAVGTGCHYLIVVVLVSGLRQPVLMATSVGATFGALVNYILNHQLVFRSKRPHGSALPRYILVAAFGIVLNTAVVAVLLPVFGHYLPAQLLATAAVLVTGFLLNYQWTFYS